MPLALPIHTVKNWNLGVAEGINWAQNKGGDQGAEETPPQGLQGEIIRNLLQGKQNSTLKTMRENKWKQGRTDKYAFLEKRGQVILETLTVQLTFDS